MTGGAARTRRQARPGTRAPTGLGPQRSPIQLLVRSGRFESAVGFIAGAALLACGALAVVAAIAGAIADQRDVATFVVLGAVYLGLGGALAHECRPPDRLRSRVAFVGVLGSWLCAVAASTVTYTALGIFDHPDLALFESVSGFTTTAATVVADPESLGRATLLWRAGTQWLGGLAALLFVVAVLPSIGVGGLDVTQPPTRYSGMSLRSRRTTGLVRRLTVLYLSLSGAGVVLFLVGGLPPFDALTYAATTISTGGFANHAGSFGHFDSASVEWAGFGGMVLGGANMALLVRLVRGPERGRLLWSFELRAYLLVVLVGGAIVALGTLPDGGATHESIRGAYFHVAAATSTTGHFVGSGWGTWSVGPQVLLLAIMGVGAMSGSAGGGFRLVRALALLGYLRRELVLQVQPRAVAPVRVGRRVVSEELVGRMIGYQAQYLTAAGVGAIVIAALGADLVTAISAAISALANVGPALGELVPGEGGVLGLPRPARAALMPLMLLGRLEIAPVLVGIAAVSAGVGERLRNGVVR